MDNVAVNPLVEQSWTEIGCRVRPTNRWVFVRTLPVSEKTESGLLWLPETVSGLMATRGGGELPHTRFVKATVIAVGPKATVKVGEDVVFQRLYFTWWKKLEDGTFIGWIDDAQMAGYPAD